MFPNKFPRYLPFPDLPPNRFEDLTRELMRAVDGVDRIRSYGRSGQDQGGLDLFGWKGDQFHVYQVRRIDKLSPKALEKAVTDFTIFPGARTQDGRRLEASRFIVVVACLASDTSVEDQLLALKAEYINDLDIDLYDGESLSDKLRHHPRIVEAYFGTEWAKAFCADSVHSEAGSAPSWKGLLDGPVSDLGLEGLLKTANEQLESDPAGAAAVFAELATRMAGVYPAHASTLRRKQYQALIAAQDHRSAFRVGCEIVIEQYETGTQLNHLQELGKIAPELDSDAVSCFTVLNSLKSWLQGGGFDLPEVARQLETVCGKPNSLSRFMLLAIAEQVLTDEDPDDDVQLLIPLLEGATVESGFDKTSTRLRCVLADFLIQTRRADTKQAYASLERDAHSGYLIDSLAGLVFMRMGRSHAFEGETVEAITAYRVAVIRTSHAKLHGDTRGALKATLYLETLQGNVDDQLQAAVACLAGRQTLIDDGSVAGAFATELLLKTDFPQALTFAKRATWKARVSGALLDEQKDRSQLGQAWNQPGLEITALRHMIISGDSKAAKSLAGKAEVFLDIATSLSAKAAWVQAAAAQAIEAQANLVPDDRVESVAQALLMLAMSHHPSMFQPSPDLDAHKALAAMCERLPNFVSEILVHRFESLIPRAKNEYRFTDDAMLKILSGVARSHKGLTEKALHLLLACLDYDVNHAAQALTTVEESSRALLTDALKERASKGSVWAERVLSSWDISTASSWEHCERLASIVLNEPVGQPRVVYGIGSPIPELCTMLLGPLPRLRSTSTQMPPVKLRQAVAEHLLRWIEDRFDTASRRRDAAVGFRILTTVLSKATRKGALGRLLSVFDGPGEHQFDLFERGSSHPLSRVRFDLGGSNFRYEVLDAALGCITSHSQATEIERRLLPELRTIGSASADTQELLASMIIELNKYKTSPLRFLVTHPTAVIRQAGVQCWIDRGCEDSEILRAVLEDKDLSVTATLARNLDSISQAHADQSSGLRERLSKHPDFRIRRLLHLPQSASRLKEVNGAG